MRSFILAAGLVLAATTAQAQNLACSILDRNGMTVSTSPPVLYRLDQPRQVAVGEGDLRWRLRTEPTAYLLDRVDARTGEFLMIGIDRDSGKAVLVVTPPGQGQKAYISGHLYCARPARL